MAVASAATTMATSRDRRAPRTTRANRSWPMASVPNQWSNEGGAESCGVSSSYPYLEIVVPRNDMRIRKRRTTRLMVASRWPRNRRTGSATAGTGVEIAVDEVSQNVAGDHQDGCDQQPRLDDVHVLHLQGLDEQPAHAAPAEDRLGDDDAAQDSGDVDRHHRQDRYE